MATERITIRLPDGFDPTRHVPALVKLVADKHGDGWEIDHIDPVEQLAYATRQATITEVQASHHSAEAFEVRLAKGTKPSDGDRVATRLEAAHEGFSVTKYEPYLGIAELTRLNTATIRCRNAVAITLGVKPWEVTIRQRPDSGWDMNLPDKYVPSKHDEKLCEVAEAVVGHVGWAFDANPQKLTASIIPGEPPTFDPTVPYPTSRRFTRHKTGDSGWADIPVGLVLPKRAGDDPTELLISLEAAPHSLVSGVSGGGKTVTINAFIAGCLARGTELVVVDLPAKSVDFLWCKQFVRDGGWGCNSLAEAVTSLALVYAEGERRAKLLAEHGATSWVDLPASVGLRPIVVIVDEVTGLFYPEEVPKGLPKDHPLVVKPTEVNLLKATLKSYVARIAAELRFVGVKLLLSSQVSSTTTGVPTAIRLNLANKLLMGTKPTDNNRRLALSDPSSVPKVPGHVAEDAQAGRGVGVAELEGRTPAVFKSYFASTGDYQEWLTSLGCPISERPAPTVNEVAAHTPTLDDVRQSAKKKKTTGDGHSGPGLAAHSGPAVEVVDLPSMCGSCGSQIDPRTGDCSCSW